MLKVQNKKIRIKYKNDEIVIDCFLRGGKRGTIIYLHGLGCSKEDFEKALYAPQLKDFKIIGFDFPGHGKSTYPKNLHLGMDDLVNMTNIVVKKLKLSNFVIIGHSMGGLVALLYVEKYKKKVSGFINVEGNLASEDCFFSREVIGHPFKVFSKYIFPSIKERVKERNNKGFQVYFKHLQKTKPKAYYDYCPTMTSYSDSGNLIERFIKLKIPKMFIYGSENRKLSYLPYLKKKCRVVGIPNSNHWPAYDNPKYFYKVIGSFLGNIFSKTL